MKLPVFIVLSFWIVVFPITSAWADDEANLRALQASEVEQQEFAQLKKMEAELTARIQELAPYFANGSLDFDGIMASQSDKLYELTMALNRFRFRSMSFWTRLVYQRADLVQIYTGSQNPKFLDLQHAFATFKSALTRFEESLMVVNRNVPDTFSTLAVDYGKLNSAHRIVITESIKYVESINAQEPSNAVRFIRSIKKRGMQAVTVAIGSALSGMLRVGWSPFKAVGKIMQGSFASKGNPIEHNFQEWLSNKGNDKLHILLAGHGGPNEVAAIAGSLALASPLKISVLQAPHHFIGGIFPDNPVTAGRIADAMAANSSIIAVLKDTSPYSGVGPDAPRLNTAISQAIRAGRRVLVIFPEGRVNGFGGGHTPVNWMSFKAVRAINTVVQQVSNEHGLGLNGVTVSFASSVLPNRDSGFGELEETPFTIQAKDLSPQTIQLLANASTAEETKVLVAAQLLDAFIVVDNHLKTASIAGSSPVSSTLGEAVQKISKRLSDCGVGDEVVEILGASRSPVLQEANN